MKYRETELRILGRKTADVVVIDGNLMQVCRRNRKEVQRMWSKLKTAG